VRVASLETEFSLKPSVEEWEQSASAGARFFRRAFDQKLASFDERFAGGEIFGAETKDSESNVLNHAHLPPPAPGEHASQKFASAALSPPASAAKKRVATAEASKDSISPADEYNRTAIYMILLRVRSTCRTGAVWRRIRGLEAIWTMLGL
jgi:hypothetical protein